MMITMSEENQDAKNGTSEMMDIGALDVYSLLGLFLGIFAEKAWQTLGLRAKPGTDKIEANFDQARVAIDTASYLADKLQPRLPEDERRRLESLVADLRLNYVRVAKTQPPSSENEKTQNQQTTTS
jgi:hypothetical protein